MLYSSGTTRCDYGYTYYFGELPKCFYGKALLSAVIIHAGKQYFTSTSLLYFFGPIE